MNLLELNNTLALPNLHPIARAEMEKVRERILEELRIAALPWHERAMIYQKSENRRLTLMMNELEKTSNRIFTPYD